LEDDEPELAEVPVVAVAVPVVKNESSSSLSSSSFSNQTNDQSRSQKQLQVQLLQKQTVQLLPKQPQQPAIVWLMSFPNSGTSYTLQNTELLTNASTGTNYGDETGIADINQRRRIGLHQHPSTSAAAAPFVHQTHLTLPPTVLTKTHCTVSFDYREFENGCRTTRWSIAGKSNAGKAVYELSPTPTAATTILSEGTHGGPFQKVPIRGAVHLVRHPLDNIVSRMHHAVKKKARRGWTPEQIAHYNDGTPAGFHAWCRYVDAIGQARRMTPADQKLFRATNGTVPCFFDLVHYVRWHNLALQVEQQYHLPVHYLYYEDYSLHYNETIHDLYDFLELPIQPQSESSMKPFAYFKTYRDFYTAQEQESVATVVKQLATPECWQLLQRYFDQQEYDDQPERNGQDKETSSQ